MSIKCSTWLRRRENAIFALSRVKQTDGSFQTLVKQRLNDDERIASQPNVLAGAADIAVSPDGMFIYVAATREGTTGKIAIFDRKVTTIDGLQFNSDVSTLVFDIQVDFNAANAIAQLVMSPDGKQLYASGPNGLQVFTRNVTTGGLTALQSLPEFTLGDIKFLDDNLVYAIDPANDKLLVFDRALDGQLTKRNEVITRDEPRSVEIGPAIDPGIPAGRFIYVASAATSSIVVYDELGTDTVDNAIDGNMRQRQVVREGVRGVRGLQGVSTLQMSAAIADAVLAFDDGTIDASRDLISTERPHRLLTGQRIRFNSADDLPSGAAVDTDYFVRKVDDHKFQLFTTSNEARSTSSAGLLDLTTAANSAGGTYVLHTSTPAGAYVYGLGRDANAIAVFERDIDPNSPTAGQLNFLQVVRNRVGNQTSGANFGLFQPNSIVAPTDDTSTVYVGTGFDNPYLRCTRWFCSSAQQPQ